MKHLRIIDSSFQLLGEIDDYETLSFTRRWHTYGAFELRINRHKRNTDTLQKGNIIIIGGSQTKVGIIKHREISVNEGSKQSEQWVIKGTTLGGIFSGRLTDPPNKDHDSVKVTAESAMKHYVNNHVINPAVTGRKITQLQNATDLGRGSVVDWQSRFASLPAELEAISIISGIGWNVTIDFTLLKWIFDVKVGRDLTVNQTVNPPVIFSPQFDNVKEAHLIDSDLEYKNVAYVAGQGEGAARRVVIVGTATGLDRAELFVDARDVEEKDENGVQLPAATINARLTERGQQALAEHNRELTLNAQVFSTDSMKYEEDWDLGDTVTVQNRTWKVTLDARITEVTEIYESDGFKLEVTFGNSYPTLIDKIKSEFRMIGNEMKR
ncbi:siphovirus ReqiPepy6 Gp37-like family protein [Fictibacillus sp. 26RED30]|uniref:siphovirus ReqiPepy6 Gp37-like family protein n=1 Tax=Fictibacillus sp. 26RED30 TaxID=2745877 RepID=UPI0018CFAC28|nr:siphovirus ReqiPepy6 Gp37-like family protein [Fictibacillus sp. 26RED30]MBH0159892.1 siphovirus ReqiPepy6 Gp37-like family protein [Fictibacillus sp. 26RED30]